MDRGTETTQRSGNSEGIIVKLDLDPRIMGKIVMRETESASVARLSLMNAGSPNQQGDKAGGDRPDQSPDNGAEQHVPAVRRRYGFSLKPLPFIVGFLIGTALMIGLLGLLK